MADIEFNYSCVALDKYSGEIWFPLGDKRGCVQFHETTWSRALTCFASVLKAVDSNDVTVSRSDKPGREPFRVPAFEVELFRKDPVAGIRLWTAADIVVDTRKSKSPSQMRPLPMGYDEKAEFFCENVFVRVDPEQRMVEDVVTGYWRPIDDNNMYIAGVDHTTKLLDMDKHKYWGEIPVEYVIGLPYERFFIPRAWNTSKPWVTKEVLVQKLSELRTMKENSK